jgi:hypothetical protein
MLKAQQPKEAFEYNQSEKLPGLSFVPSSFGLFIIQIQMVDVPFSQNSIDNPDAGPRCLGPKKE